MFYISFVVVVSRILCHLFLSPNKEHVFKTRKFAYRTVATVIHQLSLTVLSGLLYLYRQNQQRTSQQQQQQQQQTQQQSKEIVNKNKKYAALVVVRTQSSPDDSQHGCFYFLQSERPWLEYILLGISVITLRGTINFGLKYIDFNTKVVSKTALCLKSLV